MVSLLVERMMMLIVKSEQINDAEAVTVKIDLAACEQMKLMQSMFLVSMKLKNEAINTRLFQKTPMTEDSLSAVLGPPIQKSPNFNY